MFTNTILSRPLAAGSPSCRPPSCIPRPAATLAYLPRSPRFSAASAVPTFVLDEKIPSAEAEQAHISFQNSLSVSPLPDGPPPAAPVFPNCLRLPVVQGWRPDSKLVGPQTRCISKFDPLMTSFKIRIILAKYELAKSQTPTKSNHKMYLRNEWTSSRGRDFLTSYSN